MAAAVSLHSTLALCPGWAEHFESLYMLYIYTMRYWEEIVEPPMILPSILGGSKDPSKPAPDARLGGLVCQQGLWLFTLRHFTILP